MRGYLLRYHAVRGHSPVYRQLNRQITVYAWSVLFWLVVEQYGYACGLYIHFSIFHIVDPFLKGHSVIRYVNFNFFNFGFSIPGKKSNQT